ncbi:GNAT family N-acetyltransferase [Paraburkholderia fungorum]|uniref:GNAT family N-acetyltransferase n=1 Tax=Paraburkholderia fungorum TaxID=134537 RepID=UPI0038BCBBDA
MPLILRRAELNDAEELTGMYLRSRNELASYAPLIHSDASVRDWLANVLIPSGNVTVAVDDGTIVGMASHSISEGIGWLDQLYICPRFKRRGIGTLLLDSVKARTNGDLQLYTFQMNSVAIAFYEHHGFVAVGYGDGSNNEEQCPDVLYRLTQ